MGDQQKWFKLWCNAPLDPSLQALSPSERWAWAAFGCYVKVHGTNGRIALSTLPAHNRGLAAFMGCEPGEVMDIVHRLPHLDLQPDKSGTGLFRNGTIVVTFRNWYKYQQDTTGADRQRALRSKRRGEERIDRGEENTSTCGSCAQVIDRLNSIAGTKYKPKGQAVRNLHQRHQEFSVQDCLTVLRVKSAWLGDSHMEKFFRPSTLFRPSHFEEYLNEVSPENRDEVDQFGYKTCRKHGGKYIEQCSRCQQGGGDEVS